MPPTQTISDLVEEVRELAEKSANQDARSALIYCIKQLKIALAAKRQEEEENGLPFADD